MYKYEDRFSFIRRHFLSFQEDEASDLQGQLLELQNNEINLATLNLPVEEEAFGIEVEEDLFEQLYSAQKNRNKRTDLNYQQLFVDNHFREEWAFKSESSFAFKLVFLQKVVSSTNEENFGQLILSILNMLFIWFDLGVLDLHPLLVRLAVLLSNKITQFLLFACKCLRKLESPLYELLKPRKQIARRTHRF